MTSDTIRSSSPPEFHQFLYGGEHRCSSFPGCRDRGRGGNGEGVPARNDENKQRPAVTVGTSRILSILADFLSQLRLGLRYLNLFLTLVPQARWRHEGLPARVCVESGVYGQRVHEVEGGRKWTTKAGSECVVGMSSTHPHESSSLVSWWLISVPLKCIKGDILYHQL